MSENVGGDVSRAITGVVWFLCFWGFLAVKIGGSALAAWSWWWVLLPIIPVFARLLERF